MEIIVDCPECGTSEVQMHGKKEWINYDNVSLFSGRCEGCNVYVIADLIPYGTSIKLFVNVVDEKEFHERIDFHH